MLVTRTKNNFVPAFANIFDDFMKFMPAENSFFRPAVNISENANGYELEVVAPGFEKQNFELKIEKGQLTILGTKQTEKVEESNEAAPKYNRREYVAASFSRSFVLPDHVDTQKIKARYENGILRVELPRQVQEAVVVQNIEIE